MRFETVIALLSVSLIVGIFVYGFINLNYLDKPRILKATVTSYSKHVIPHFKYDNVTYHRIYYGNGKNFLVFYEVNDCGFGEDLTLKEESTYIFTYLPTKSGRNAIPRLLNVLWVS